MLGMLKRLYREQKGQSLVEIALVLPVLLLMLGGLVDFGRGFRGYIVITNASREGARYACLFPHDADGILSATTEAAADLGAALEADDIEITGVGGSSGDTIRVTVTYDLSTILGSIIGVPTLTLNGSTAMVIFGMDV